MNKQEWPSCGVVSKETFAGVISGMEWRSTGIGGGAGNPAEEGGDV